MTEVISNNTPTMDTASSNLPEIEKTNNHAGHTFNKIIESADYWLSSLPRSSRPLLDLGAAYGVHTLHAMRTGRNVIAVDADDTHIRVLKERAKALSKEKSSSRLGRLVDAKVALLPSKNLCSSNSVSGVLLSEVLHFLKPEKSVDLMKDVYRWLEPGGVAVVTAISSYHFDHPFFKDDWEPMNLSKKKVRELLDAANRRNPKISGEELLKIAPGYMKRPAAKSEREIRESNLGESLYAFTTLEIKTIAEMAGFQVEKIDYISPRRYPIIPPDVTKETVLLVARKPKA